jgi:hypothetical protein
MDNILHVTRRHVNAKFNRRRVRTRIDVQSNDKTGAKMDVTVSPKTISVVEAGRKYFGLKRAGSYAAAARGELPTIRLGRRLRVSVVALERMLAEARPIPSQDEAA